MLRPHRLIVAFVVLGAAADLPSAFLSPSLKAPNHSIERSQAFKSNRETTTRMSTSGSQKSAGFATLAGLAIVLVSVFDPAPVAAETVPAGTNVFNSLCLGFGCSSFNHLDYNGAEAPTDEASIPFNDFLAAVDAGKVLNVEFFGANGDKAYAFIAGDGADAAPMRVRIGAGFPAEQSDGYSSPLWLVRALGDRKVPYRFMYDLGTRSKMLTVSK